MKVETVTSQTLHPNVSQKRQFVHLRQRSPPLSSYEWGEL